ncbi:MAG: hypothetical protein GF393_12310 [Armatimonadia bacterium]|nr:hypothetical protein [Armatimonadia bacterium]
MTIEQDRFPPITVLAGYFDIPVAIRRATWDDHVATRHPEVLSYFDHVVSTIEEPHVISRDRRHPERVYFYRQWPEIVDFPGKWLQVLVLIPRGARRGSVISAWAARRIGGKETIWRASDQS